MEGLENQKETVNHGIVASVLVKKMNCALFFVNVFGHCLTALCSLFLGRGPATKSDEFSEKFNPSSFSEFMLHFFVTEMVAYMRGGMMAR